MKTLVIASIIASVTASASFATNWNTDGSVNWGGNSGGYNTVGCKYKDQDTGVMTLAEDSLVWKTTKAATIRVRSYGQGNIQITTNNVLTDGTTDYTVVVDYTGDAPATSSLTGSKISSPQINSNMISYQTAQTGRTKSVIKIGGTATMTDATSDEIKNNEDYTITHTVTCLQ